MFEKNNTIRPISKTEETAFQSRLITYIIKNNMGIKDVQVFLNHLDNPVIGQLKQALKKKILKVYIVFFAIYKRGTNEENMEYKECNFKTQNSNLSNFYTNTKIKIVNEIEDFVMKNSQWRLHQILSLGININKYVPFKGSSYIPLPEHIQNKHAIINVKNKDDKCFLWAILSALHHVEKDGQRVTKYIPFENEFDNELKVNDIEIPIRKLITPFKRIILANVYPIIPNSLIIEALQKEGIKTTSSITTIKSEYAHTSNEFVHIGSFKRQTYIHPDDITKLPSSILIFFEETNYRIFITDTITCFLCKQTGHLSSSYKLFSETVDSNPKIINKESPSLTSTLNHESIQLNSIKSNENVIILDPIINTDNITSAIMDIQEHQDTNKRPAPESTCPSSPRLPSSNTPKMTEKFEHNSNNDHIKNKITKKPKIRSRSNSSTRNTDKLEDQLKPAINIFDQNKDLNLNAYTFKFIVENFSNKNINIHDLCEQVGANTTDLLNIIEKVRPVLTDRSVKSKMTKLSNLLFQSLPPLALGSGQLILIPNFQNSINNILLI
ncbi:hypothetical protein QTP88_009945 [Uroleucon formosanum]